MSHREKCGGREERNHDSAATIKDVNGRDCDCVERARLRERTAETQRRDGTHQFGVHETTRVAQRARTWSRREERRCQRRGRLSYQPDVARSQGRLTHWAPAPFRRRGGAAPQTRLSLGSRRVLGLHRRARGHPKRTSEHQNRRRDEQTDVTHLSASSSGVSLAFFRGSIH